MYPPSRNAGALSTSVGVKPHFSSQKANVGPAMPAHGNEYSHDCQFRVVVAVLQRPIINSQYHSVTSRRMLHRVTRPLV